VESGCFQKRVLTRPAQWPNGSRSNIRTRSQSVCDFEGPSQALAYPQPQPAAYSSQYPTVHSDLGGLAAAAVCTQARVTELRPGKLRGNTDESATRGLDAFSDTTENCLLITFGAVGWPPQIYKWLPRALKKALGKGETVGLLDSGYCRKAEATTNNSITLQAAA